MNRYLRIPSVLEQLARARHPQTLAQLAMRLSLPKSTLTRILSVLAREGLVEYAPGERGYILGSRATHLALSILNTPHFSRETRAILSRLVELTGESCNLTAPEGDSMRYLARVETKYMLSLKMEVGAHVPLHCTASGKLMLGMMGKAARSATLDRLSLEPYTQRTLTDRVLLEEELSAINQQRMGIDQEEFILGMVATAVPVLDSKGKMIAALACHGPTARVSMKTLEKYLSAMRESAAHMGRILGREFKF